MAGLLRRLGGFCARHSLLVIGAWVLVLVTVVVAVSTVGAKTSNDLALPGTGSQEAKDLLTERFPPQQNGVNPIVFHVSTGKLTDSANKQAVDDAVKEISKQPHVLTVTNPLSSDGQIAGLLSKDGRTAFAPVLMDVGSGDLTEEIAGNVLDATHPAQKVGITTAAGGSIGSTLSTDESRTSEVVGIIAAMIILSLVLGSLVAMGLPIITAVVGLGVALFLITRHQDQLREGMPIRESIAHAVATSGSAIVFAGCTVVVALLALGVAGIPLVSTLGYASAMAVVAAVLVAITLLPAFLGLLGHRIGWASLPAFMRPGRRRGRGLWARCAGVVHRHPWVVAGVSLAALVPLIIPVLSLELGQEDVGATSKETTERQAYDLISTGLGVDCNGPLQVPPPWTRPRPRARSTPRSTTERCRSSPTWRRSRRSCPSRRSSSRPSRHSSRTNRHISKPSRRRWNERARSCRRSRPTSSGRPRRCAGSRPTSSGRPSGSGSVSASWNAASRAPSGTATRPRWNDCRPASTSSRPRPTRCAGRRTRWSSRRRSSRRRPTIWRRSSNRPSRSRRRQSSCRTSSPR